jgi:hypothetical protein
MISLTAALGPGEAVEPFPQFRLQPQGHNSFLRHDRLRIQENALYFVTAAAISHRRLGLDRVILIAVADANQTGT